MNALQKNKRLINDTLFYLTVNLPINLIKTIPFIITPYYALS